MGEEVNNDDDEQLFDPTASQDYSFEAGSSQDYDAVGGLSDQDYSLGVADGQDYSLGTAGSVRSSQDYSLTAGGSVSSSQDYSLESEDPSSGPLTTSSFLLEDTNQDSEDALLTSADYFGNWEEYPSEDAAPAVLQVDQVSLLQGDQVPDLHAAPAVLQVDQVVQLRVPEAVLNIGEEEEGGDVPVPEPEADHHHLDDGEHAVGDGHHQGIARPDFEDPATILVGGPVTPAQDLGQIQEVATSY